MQWCGRPGLQRLRGGWAGTQRGGGSAGFALMAARWGFGFGVRSVGAGGASRRLRPWLVVDVDGGGPAVLGRGGMGAGGRWQSWSWWCGPLVV